MKKAGTEEEGNDMFDAFSKADLPTVQALIKSKPDLVSQRYLHLLMCCTQLSMQGKES